MAKIRKKKPSESLNLTDAFNEFKISQSAKGIKDKTLQTYSSHFLASSKHLDMSLTFDQLTQGDLQLSNEVILIATFPFVPPPKIKHVN